MKPAPWQEPILKRYANRPPTTGGQRTAYEKGAAGFPNIYPRSSLAFVAWLAGNLTHKTKQP